MGRESPAEQEGRGERRSLRLRGFDYREPGQYFVTICTQNRLPQFGAINAGEMRLNEPGRMVDTVWTQLPECASNVDVDFHIVMPNHMHGVIVLADTASPAVGAGPRACPPNDTSLTLALPDVVHRFKSLTTARYRRGAAEQGWPPFPGRLWQRNYYEHVIRSERELQLIRKYIAENPARWESDAENPECGTGREPLPWD